ncbi:MAG: hypothetical protein JNL70_23455 [Saprospiraceae bacterium]|nr:hypothetical protein [Saprospiraceae bacterium]
MAKDVTPVIASEAKQAIKSQAYRPYEQSEAICKVGRRITKVASFPSQGLRSPFNRLLRSARNDDRCLLMESEAKHKSRTHTSPQYNNVVIASATPSLRAERSNL